MSDELAERLSATGLDDGKVKEILKNKSVAEALVAISDEVGPQAPKRPILFHQLAIATRTATPDQLTRRSFVSHAIADGRLNSSQQVDAAWKYVSATPDPTVSQLNIEAGVGVVVTPEEVKKATSSYIAENRSQIEQQRYRFLGRALGAVKAIPSMKWASPGLIKDTVASEFETFLGPRDDRDDPKKLKAASKAKQKVGEASESPEKPNNEVAHNMFTEGFLGSLHRPEDTPQKYPGLIEEHLKRVGKCVITRFPPEPNGFLHIGHAKAIATDFGYAAYHGGRCILRFDDTNPEAEDTRFSDSISSLVEWLGFKPYRVTWSSDYFDELYALAEKLIENKGAYVCFCTPEQVKSHRGLKEDGTPGGERSACEHRSQKPQESLELFRQMRDGKYKKGEATLRMRQDLSDSNPQMWDLVAYRVLNASHHRTGDKWRIYPTYDFTHCLVDSLEDVTHSLCTLEFRLSRESYEWLCDAVHVYRPAQREFGRLNLVGAVMSKRKLAQLVNGKYVRAWDDPRLYTLVGLRRRGVPPGAILSFVNELGVTTSTSSIEVVRFETTIRRYLEHNVPRLMMVLDPIRVVLKNLPEDYYETIEEVPFKPNNPQMGSHSLPFTRVLYIDRSDFREEASSSYFRLAPGQSVGLLKVPHTIRFVSLSKDACGNITEICAHYENDLPAPKKPKTFIQWVAESPKDKSPVPLREVREFERLFKSDNPGSNPDGFLADINPDSKRLWPNAVIETGFHEVKAKSPWKPEALSQEEEILEGNDAKGAPEAVRFQALRVGYFAMDSDSSDDAIILNRIVTLKEDKTKDL